MSYNIAVYYYSCYSIVHYYAFPHYSVILSSLSSSVGTFITDGADQGVKTIIQMLDIPTKLLETLNYFNNLTLLTFNDYSLAIGLNHIHFLTF